VNGSRYSPARRSAAYRPAAPASGPRPMLGDLVHSLLEAAYDRCLTDETVGKLCNECGVFPWLTMCLTNAPSSHEGAGGGSSSSSSCGGSSTLGVDTLVFAAFVQLARLVALALQNTSCGFPCTEHLHDFRDQALREARCLHEDWLGPFIDNASGREYYYHAATSRSSWRMPAEFPLYMAWVAEKLLLCSNLFPADRIGRCGKALPADAKTHAMLVY